MTGDRVEALRQCVTTTGFDPCAALNEFLHFVADLYPESTPYQGLLAQPVLAAIGYPVSIRQTGGLLWGGEPGCTSAFFLFMAEGLGVSARFDRSFGQGRHTDVAILDIRELLGGQVYPNGLHTSQGAPDDKRARAPGREDLLPHLCRPV